MTGRVGSRAAGLALGFVADRLLGDPRRWHPVAGFGTLAGHLEKRTYAAGRAPGVAHVALLVGSTAALGLMAERVTRRSPVAHAAATAAATWAVLGGRSLVREGDVISGQLSSGDLAAARLRLRNLVGRDTTRLDPDGIARACVESVAENTSDAVVAPLLWGGALGVPGLLAYRAVNTLDAMVGHRTPRYREFGWAAARLDDVANWVPARFAAGAALTSAALDGDSVAVSRARDAIRHDAPAHPSPNGGVVEAAFAGVLGVTLGGTNVYEGRAEDRGSLGAGPSPAAYDIGRANRLSRRVGTLSLLGAMALAAARSRGAAAAAGPGGSPGP
ncbi:cobalamin biosynthesis protein [Intrasporangium calvum]|uniref:Cobalamin biosynthesis protein CobD n=1 Tax=Intrasporangium calvum TaxID=53358 RepID=A0ABT5GD65_9MICO|nr:cobalamin biosynthesis protein [Intrasporangium calvum]MDC5696187.1 cobalamin biosynthesis protein [Intrasporangium calvum]